ncbi:MAG: 3 protein, partial [Candidatus Hydrogenedentes bacterium]|nr:3 protein [Candidatus Hydrogenedentota bacterium]
MRYLHILSLVFVSIVCLGARAEDWPVYQHDNARSGVSGEVLGLPLHEVWVHVSRHAPAPAWPPPAERDIWNEVSELRPTVTYDRAFHPVAAGDAVFFGSSADDQVYCLDAASGAIRWRFFTEGPVRLAPAIADGKVYAGSDDGAVYCLDASSGTLLWKHRAVEDVSIPGNGRVISSAPVRTGVLVDNGIAYFFAGLFPAQNVFRCALDAATGAVRWNERAVDISPQGYLLASSSRLFVPTGRTEPAVFTLADGKYQGMVEGHGGAYALVTPEDLLLSGPGRRQGGIDLIDPELKETLVQFDGLRMIVHEGIAYMQSKRSISALDRTRHTQLAREYHPLVKRRDEIKQQLKKLAAESPEAQALNAEAPALDVRIEALSNDMKACRLWEQPSWHPYAMILAGGTLFMGGDGEVAALDAADGAALWTGKVNGIAHGLAVANGSLLVSTDQGAIYCFRTADPEREYVVQPEPAAEPYPADRLQAFYAETAEQLLDAAFAERPDAPRKGYILVLDCGEGRLAYELARRSDMKVVGIESDPAKVADARERLDRAGLYGPRVSVQEADSVKLPYTSCFANLIVSDGALCGGEIAAPADEVYRVLRPYGGLAMLGQPRRIPRGIDKLRGDALGRWTDPSAEKWTVRKQDGLWASLRRGAMPGAGEWTQLYADAGHTACSGDAIEGPMRIQWFGEPGPREMIDRHHRPMSSLFKNGRVFIPANDLVIAIDPFNGSTLWRLDVPNSRRAGALRNCGHMLVADDLLYVAVEGACWAIDVVTGERKFVHDAPQLEDGPSDWGYLNHVGDTLFGSGMKPDASFQRLSKVTVNDLIENDFRPMIASTYLFAMNRYTGEVLWTYQGGVLMNNGITAGEGRIYLIESRSEKALANTDGRLRVDHFCEDGVSIAALDEKTGEKLWEQPFQFPYSQIMFLSNANKVLLSVGTSNVGDKVQYDLYGFDTATGAPKWHNSCQNGDPIGGSHGEQWQHPVIIGNRVFSDPFAFDLQTGEQQPYRLDRGGHGCGGLTGSLHYMYGRGANPRMYPIDVDKTQGVRLTDVSRPGCWLNIIPAGGIVTIPESSSGCSCAYPIQTS